MERQPYEIECGRCGETRLEFLTEGEARDISDGVGPAYRQCERCGKVTGWIEASAKHAATGEMKQCLRQRPPASGQPAEGLVSRGQERMATQSERDRVDAMLHRPHGL